MGDRAKRPPSDNTRMFVLLVRALRAMVFVAALLAGYAAGIALLQWRSVPYFAIDTAAGKIDSAIRNGEIGIEQVRPDRTEFETYASHQAHLWEGFAYRSSRWILGEWIYLAFLFVLPAFVGLGLACRAPKWMAPKAARIAFKGPDGSAAIAIWKDTLRRSVACVQKPSAIAAAVLAGFAIVVLCDLCEFLLRLAEKSTAGQSTFVFFWDFESLFVTAVIVSFVLVVIWARRQIKRNPEMAQGWCVRCGYSLRAHLADPSGPVCCPECGRAVQQTPGAHRAGPRYVPAITLLVALAMLLALHHWTSRLEDIKEFLHPNNWVKSNGIYVKVGGVVRMQSPYGTTWFLVEPTNPWNGGSLTFEDVVLRVVADLRDPTSASADPKTIRKLFTVKVNDPNWNNPAHGFTWTTITKLGNGNPMYLTADWNGSNLVLISLFPPGATSIRAVDPATAPPFD